MATPKSRYTYSEHCDVIRETFGRLGDKWTLVVIVILSAGPQRFSALQNGVVGISQRMLTVTLRKLERDGIVRRTVFAEVPPRVEYELTPMGVTLIAPVTALADWSIENHEVIAQHQTSADAKYGTEFVPTSVRPKTSYVGSTTALLVP